MWRDDTIVGVATAPGRGGIAVVRLSGPEAHGIARRRVRPWPAQARRATLAQVRDVDGNLLDRALVTRFDGPASFTGEDTVELATHGGAVVPALVVAALVSSGARIAEPGEFTRRAVLSGKLDLAQAEATGDLVDARSRAMHRAALAHLDGGLSRRIAALREEVLAAEALIAYDIDFPEEDDGPVPRTRVSAAVGRVLAGVEALAATAPAGELVRDGALVVIAGAPNAGKSSLFNALLGTERAIVTPVPGTTRDAIEATLDTGRWPLRLVDTAGLRETSDPVERIGVAVSARYLRAADVVLACGETDAAVHATVAAVQQGDTAAMAAAVLPVRTKGDLGGSTVPLVTSAEQGTGMAGLLEAIARAVEARHGTIPEDTAILTRARHRQAVEHARGELRAFLAAWETDVLPATIAAVHLRDAAEALADVIGGIDAEEIMDRLFRTFCVGK